jgi:hypothetical protein
MKTYVHARLGASERAALAKLRASTGMSDSELVRRGLQLVAEHERRRRTALDLAGASVGRFGRGPRDLSTHRKHLEGFGA